MAKELQEAGQWKVGEKVLVVYPVASLGTSLISEITRISQHYGKIEINVKHGNNLHAYSFDIDGWSKTRGYNVPHMEKYTEIEADKIRCNIVRNRMSRVQWDKVPDPTLKAIWKIYNSAMGQNPAIPTANEGE